MGSIYMAIDISEISGRHLLGSIEDGRLKLEEIYKFENKFIEKDGNKILDLGYIFEQIKTGLIKSREIGKLPILVGITACDGSYVLLDSDNKVIGDKVFYLDANIDFGTYRNNNFTYIDRAESFLMVSDYFNFLLTGRKQCEYTNLVPRKLISWDTKDWDEEYISKLGLMITHFPPISHPGSVIGNLTILVTEEVGYDFIVVQPASRKASAAILKMPGINDTDKEENKQDIDKVEDIPNTGKTEKMQNVEKTEKIQNIEKTEKIQNTDSTVDIRNDVITDGVQDNENIAYDLKAAIGSLCILMITSHELKDFEDARECIRNTFYP